MRPMFLFFGAKWRLAKSLGPPQRDTIIEPFAGSAGYSSYWAERARRVILVGIDPVIAGLWRYLTKVREREILSLPTNIHDLNELPRSTCQEARDLIGLWFNRAVVKPQQRRSQWAREPRYATMFWGECIKYRIAQQLKYVRHWEIRESDYTAAPDLTAHWHIDPPYEQAGKHYEHNHIDRDALARWCRTRKGFTQVCEAEHATWLPFEQFGRTTSHHRAHGVRAHGYSQEAIFETEPSTETPHHAAHVQRRLTPNSRVHPPKPSPKTAPRPPHSRN